MGRSALMPADSSVLALSHRTDPGEDAWPTTIMTRWLERPSLFIFPAVGVVAAVLLARSVRRRNDRMPLLMAALGFAAAFGTFLVTFWPNMVPFSITIAQAAAPQSSLSFMFWGEGLFVLPLMLAYTAISYRVFRGKSDATWEQHE